MPGASLVQETLRFLRRECSGTLEVEAPCSDGRFQSPTETHDHIFQTGGNRHAGLRDHGRGYVFLFRG